MSAGFTDRHPALYLVDGRAPEDQVVRLQRFREEHPDIEVLWRGPWEAVIPESDGAQRVVVRYELNDLLNEVERRLAVSAEDPGVPESELGS